MEEDTVELVDYLRVIWKRKRLIIVGTLVCMVVAGVVSLRLPEIYRAEALIKIGKILVSPSPSSLASIDTPGNLTKSIPAEYGLNEEEASKYFLKAEEVRGTSLIKATLEGPDRRRVEELLKGIVNRLIDDHLRKTENSIQPYRVLIGKLETDIKMIQKDTAQLEARLKKMNTEKTDPVIVMITQNNLGQKGTNLRNIRQDLLLYRSVVDRLHEYKTKVIGGIKANKNPIKPRKKRIILTVGVVGLMMSLFMAFFIRYLGKIREREKGKEEG
jgi:uncharacterized protein involved in exopolysaccharide biosynthesis